MGFISDFCTIKALCLVGIWRIEDEEAIGYVEMDAKLKKAMRVITLIKQCKELASRTQDASEFLGKRPVTTWEHGKEDLSEWSERKGDNMYSLANYYKKRVVKLKHLLVELIETLD